MRVTTSMLVSRALYDLDGLREQYAKAQDAVNGRVLGRPSDDPQLVVEAMDLSGAKERLEAAKRSGDDAKEWLAMSENSLTTMINQLQDAAETGVQANAPAGLDPDAREALAQHLDSLKVALMQELNTKHRDQYLFSGWASQTQPFTQDPTTKVAVYAGSGGQIMRDIAPGLSIAINVPGDQLTVGGDFIKTLTDMSEALRSNNMTWFQTVGQPAVAKELSTLTTLRSDLGVRQAQVEQYQGYADSSMADIEERLGKISGADLETSVLKMAQAQSAYQAALASFSKALPTSLIDYMLR